MNNNKKQIIMDLRNYKVISANLEQLKELNKIDPAEELDQKIRKTELKINNINRSLGALNEEERNVLWWSYTEGEKTYMFTHKLGCSERTVERIRARALNKMCIAIYGI